MLQVAKTPLGRKLWRLAKELHIPVSEVAEMTPEEIEFCDFSMLADDPKRLEAYENTFRDPDFEAFEKAFDEEMRQKQEAEKLMRKQRAAELEAAGYDVSEDLSGDDEWEKVE